jgi:glutamyl/glutaminyl-tRNA synthetase
MHTAPTPCCRQALVTRWHARKRANHTLIKTYVITLIVCTSQVTHSSDYFQELFDLAIVLIKKGLAYVCHMQGDDLRGHTQVQSPWANRPVEESLSLFEDMRCGLIDEGKATLRMKHTMKDGKVRCVLNSTLVLATGRQLCCVVC